MPKLFSPIDPLKPVYSGSELILIENFLDDSTCKKWVTFADKKAGAHAPVGDINNPGAAKNLKNLGFVADRINLISEAAYKNDAIALFDNVYRNMVSKNYGVSIEWFEIPHILRYTKGGNYNYHSDSEAWNEKEQCWVKGVDRDFSCVMYLNSEFTGGSLAFPYLNLRLHPRAGLLVVFPSDHRFLHSAEETLSGNRYVMVTWAARQGVARVMKSPPPHIIRL